MNFELEGLQIKEAFNFLKFQFVGNCFLLISCIVTISNDASAKNMDEHFVRAKPNR